MKNAFKLGFLALALSLTVVACSSEQKAEDATDTVVVDSNTTVVDTTHVDTTVVDTTVVAN